MEGGLGGVRAFTRFVRIAGRYVGPPLLYLGTWFVLPFLKKRRAGAKQFFFHWRGEQSGFFRTLLDTYRCFLAFTLCWYERTYVFLRGPAALSLEIEGHTLVDEALAAGKGVVLLTAHFGNFELAAWMLRRFGSTPVNVVMVDSEVPAISAYMSQLRGADQPRIIAINRSKLASLDLLSALRRKEILCIQGDRAVGAALTRVPFLGREAPFPLGPYQLAQVAGAVVIPTFSTRVGSFRYRINLYPPLDLHATGIASPAHAYVRLLERNVLLNPLQWFNLFSFWDADHAPAGDAADEAAVLPLASPSRRLSGATESAPPGLS